MATWENLTQEQRDIYQSFERELRAAMGALHAVCNDFVELNDSYNAQILAILADLDDNTVVPNTSGLAGSQGLDSDAEMVTLVSHLQSVLTNYNTSGHRQLRHKAAGINALLDG
jgi:hypothetical protein